jgi:hypothetical protein
MGEANIFNPSKISLHKAQKPIVVVFEKRESNEAHGFVLGLKKTISKLSTGCFF